MLQLDDQQIDVLRRLLGDTRLLALGQLLADGLAALAETAPDDQAERLHRLAGSAASLGFRALAAALARAETQGADMAVLAGAAPEIVPALAARLQVGPAQR